MLLLLMTAACRQNTAPPPTEIAVNIALAIPETPPVPGADTLTITLTDAANQPISGASMSVVADMTHAGMTPESGTGAETEQAGVYTVPINWTMSGDYLLTITAVLPDGTTAEQVFAWRVGT